MRDPVKFFKTFEELILLLLIVTKSSGKGAFLFRMNGRIKQERKSWKYTKVKLINILSQSSLLKENTLCFLTIFYLIALNWIFFLVMRKELTY